MPWLETHVQAERIQFVMAMQRPGAKMTHVCRAFHISRTTGYKWLGRDEADHSVTALADHSRRPHRSPHRTSRAKTARVVALREEYGWGGDKLAPLLDAEGIALAPRTIDRIIQREGLTRPDVAPAPALTRFERPAPNDLWQMDAKGHYPLRPAGRCHPLSVLDDHSRYAVGLVALPALETVGVRTALTACFERYGVPTAMLMDHGVPWWSATNEGGLTTLSVFLLKQGIELLYGRVRHPQTQGKVERFHRTLGERLRWWGVPTDLPGFAQAFATFRDEYNEVRPHEALAMQPPASRFAPSRRAFVPHPSAWDYPPGSHVQRVSAQGMLSYGADRFFVSQALAGEEVACRTLKRRVLVSYRQMYVRELHLRSGRSVPLWPVVP
jgi:transposase InsO family protein